MADDSSFILRFLCYHWLSFRSHESSLHRVFTWFLLIVCFYLFLGCIYLCFFCPCIFYGWIPILDFYLHLFIYLYFFGHYLPTKNQGPTLSPSYNRSPPLFSPIHLLNSIPPVICILPTPACIYHSYSYLPTHSPSYIL